ncbi:uncharacterized protein PHACADRAFT_259039 [Phanerochaete carnosa HHB-10118-sp]|uniref:Macro-like domain-containing protein n=1 Tax=Phanerochaete carnosa (strain HHB-10118-sp) TaxID=650164 RepID=K5W6W1_PHACS|nr:uncharacterized protein PHACADRAFT_259039 [Phanerochaete carnosa HHB-10118-sp]EKM54875.1 hypothetical protein PHACADRAFT_259039 [Phanerochaete carnosa HHB-10118-sp]
MGESKDLRRLTHHVQQVLRKRWRGFAPPSTCTLVELPSDVSGEGRNPWEARVLAVLPTMRVPQDVDWHKDLCYNSMWSLLAEIAQWNETHSDENQIRRVLMTGLGTGVGRMSAERCARQMVLAVKHFRKGWPEEPKWKDVYPASSEIESTTSL